MDLWDWARAQRRRVTLKGALIFTCLCLAGLTGMSAVAIVVTQTRVGQSAADWLDETINGQDGVGPATTPTGTWGPEPGGDQHVPPTTGATPTPVLPVDTGTTPGSTPSPTVPPVDTSLDDTATDPPLTTDPPVDPTNPPVDPPAEPPVRENPDPANPEVVSESLSDDTSVTPTTEVIDRGNDSPMLTP